MRSRINPCTQSQEVFVCKPNFMSSNPKLSFSTVTRICKKFSTKSGKQFTTRTVRSSKITYSREGNCTPAAKDDLARAMNHLTSTADASYDQTPVMNSTLRVLETSVSEGHFKDGASASSTPRKTSRVSENEENPGRDGDADETFKETRRGKIKRKVTAKIAANSQKSKKMKI